MLLVDQWQSSTVIRDFSFTHGYMLRHAHKILLYRTNTVAPLNYLCYGLIQMPQTPAFRVSSDASSDVISGLGALTALPLVFVIVSQSWLVVA